MNAITPIASKIDLTGLLSAIAQADADDSMSNPLTPAQWDRFPPTCSPMPCQPAMCCFPRVRRTERFIWSRAAA